MFKKYNFIIGKSSSGKTKLLQNFTELFDKSIIFDFESNILPTKLPNNIKYIHSKNINQVEEFLDYYFELSEEKVSVFLDNPDIFYVDKKSDLERIFKKYKDKNILFFTTLSLVSNFTQSDTEHSYQSYKKFGLFWEECSTFVVESYQKDKTFLYLEENNKYTFTDLLRDHKIEKILK
jgi:hypothetical protein